MRTELPPTDGLPLYFKDLIPFRKRLDLSQSLAKLLQIPPPILTCSGTVALIIALKTLHSQQLNRTQIILPAWTCPLVALAVEKIGFVPVLCDLAPHSLDLDLQHLKQIANSSTLAIIATHYAGLVCDVTAIQYIAKQYDIYIIEDAAQAMGSKNGAESVGLVGDIGFFSLAFGKGLTSAEGGVLFSHNAELHRQLQEHTQILPTLYTLEIKRCLELIGYYLFYKPSTLNLIYGNALRKALEQQDEIVAVGDDFDQNSIPMHQFGQWRSHVAASATTRLALHWQAAHQQAMQRIQRLKQLPHLYIFEEKSKTTATYPFLILLVDEAQLCQNILNELWSSGLGVNKLFVRAINQYPTLQHISANTPHAIDFAARSFTISNSAWLNDQYFEKIYCILERHLTQS
ncbi:hypothetical protein B9T28_03255 [Acinetobacter silvestris]|uniref:Nucleotide sugar aminotransferase n=2 Tax=Acinetobacter silvestris TaxID=1977882 RepID=A0A1Y3CN72_9GAMM|nr:hypothetical protein B9T28_03255 [Acinetobacter silvestris]